MAIKTKNQTQSFEQQAEDKENDRKQNERPEEKSVSEKVQDSMNEKLVDKGIKVDKVNTDTVANKDNTKVQREQSVGENKTTKIGWVGAQKSQGQSVDTRKQKN